MQNDEFSLLNSLMCVCCIFMLLMRPALVSHNGNAQLFGYGSEGPVPQSLIKLILDKWKILIAIYLPLNKDFSLD